MLAQPTLVKAERRVFHAYWQDGLLDIVAGVCVILIGAGALLGALVPMLGTSIVGVFVWQAARRAITDPRLGSVVFSERRIRQMRHGLIAIVSLGLVVGGNLVTRIWLKDSPTSFSQWFAPAIPATILAAMSMSCAVALGLWRFVAYGAIFAIAGLGIADATMEPWWGLVAGGTAMALWGAVMLRRFLREFPKLPGDADTDTEAEA
jgi:hypothetical protein